jgi:hypothetical protein
MPCLLWFSGGNDYDKLNLTGFLVLALWISYREMKTEWYKYCRKGLNQASISGYWLNF